MTADRRLYSMELGRRDHARWLGSNRYAGGAPPLTLPTANLLAAYDARVGVTDVSGACSAWADQSGNGCHATQGTAGARPSISTTDGFASLLFDGSTKKMVTPIIKNPPGVNTIYAVVKATAVPTVYKTIFSPGSQLLGILPSAGKWGMYDTTNRDSGVTSTTALTRVAFEQLHAASSARTWVSGVAGPDTAWLGTGTIPGGLIGSFSGGATHFWAGHILFMAAYAASHDTAVEAYITQEWGV